MLSASRKWAAAKQTTAARIGCTTLLAASTSNNIDCLDHELTAGHRSDAHWGKFQHCFNQLWLVFECAKKIWPSPLVCECPDFDIVELFFLIKVRKCLLHFIGRRHTPDTRVVYSRMTQELFCRGDWSNSCFVPPLNCWSKDQQLLFWHSWRNTSHDANAIPQFAQDFRCRLQITVSCQCQRHSHLFFSVTRSSRSDGTRLMWLWWARIPSRDLTDVTHLPRLPHLPCDNNQRS